MFEIYILACTPILVALGTMVTAAGKLFKKFKNNELEVADLKRELKAMKASYDQLKSEIHKATVAMTHVETNNIREDEEDG